MNRCFSKNVKPFILSAGFQVIVALGRIPSTICVKALVGEKEPAELKDYHGRLFVVPGQKKFLITSYHPNAFGKWDRSAVSKLIIILFEQGKVQFGA